MRPNGVYTCRRCRKKRWLMDGNLNCSMCREILWQKDHGGCLAILWHGPGHQSFTFCGVRGQHLMRGRRKVHLADYSGGSASWFGMKKFTGYFDEAPEVYTRSLTTKEDNREPRRIRPMCGFQRRPDRA